MLVIRIVRIDAGGEAGRARRRRRHIDKIGDAVWLGDGRMAGAPSLPVGETLEQQTADSLTLLGIVPAAKVKVLNLPSLDYLPSDKPEGLALIDDGPFEGSYAVLNDNDFGLFPGAEQIALGVRRRQLRQRRQPSRPQR